MDSETRFSLNAIAVKRMELCKKKFNDHEMARIFIKLEQMQNINEKLAFGPLPNFIINVDSTRQ